ncbi:DUF6468 domain-containing protein [Sphingomonas mucosissima]|uniref:DUF6468 domain-containing protein n=1 Tax=Sphingomonas mucosissima TaxID=370959 RepID=A0A245ZF03_9SPHN|nr:DUF6468 domain-containing protein [Sphingomonas mucosissima]OWK28330.1 hypothetical protein SPMU_31860 [Sphingomonas mucosissima]
MSFQILTSVATMIFCSAVLVQSVRMMRSLRAVKDGALTEVVGALDASTTQARLVLSELRQTLHDCASSSRTLANGKEIAEELSVMIGIANATAERLVEAAGAANTVRDSEEVAA